MTFWDFNHKVGEDLDRFSKDDIRPALCEGGKAGEALDSLERDTIGRTLGGARKTIDDFATGQFFPAFVGTTGSLHLFGQDKRTHALAQVEKDLSTSPKNHVLPFLGGVKTLDDLVKKMIGSLSGDLGGGIKNMLEKVGRSERI
jgi:hypothetical protein